MARAPSSGPAGAVFKLPVPLMKAALVLGVVGSTLGATLWVASVAGPSFVRIPALSGPSYARDVSGFHPLSRQLASPPLPRVAPSVKPTGHPSASPARSTPESPAQAPVPTHEPPAASPPPAPSLSVAMSAGTSGARKNRPVTFTITVTNTGPGTATNVVVESHVPDGSSLTSWMCNGTSVAAAGATSFTCGTLGAAPAPNHPLVFAVGSLAPGATITEQFTVTIDHNVKHNSAIVDHAHAYAANADLADSNIVSVAVR